MTAVTRQSMTDDSGVFTDGTVVNKAFVDQVYDQIDDQVHSSTNPTIKPKATTDEVIAARGSKSSLDARLDVALNEDGTLKTQASLITLAQAGTLAGLNLIPNDRPILWSQGDSSAPDYTALSGAGATVARTGTGLGDTETVKYGPFAVKITYGSAAAKLTWSVMDAGAFLTGFRNRKVSFGCWAKASTASLASIVVDDGVTQTRGGQGGNGTYHTGGGSAEWLYCTHTISGSATKLEVSYEVAASGSAYFQMLTGLFSDIPPADWIPCRMQKGVIFIPIAGTLTTGTQKSTFLPGAPGIITDTQLFVKTAPTGAALIVDINTWDGAAFTTAYTTKPQIAISGTLGNAAPDGTYARRCFKPIFGSSAAAGYAITADIDQIGSTVAGADLAIHVRIKQFIRELESLLAYDDL